LHDDDPDVVNAMLRFMYAFDFDDDSDHDHNDESRMAPIVFDVHVNVVADKYDMTALANLAAAKFGRRAESEWRTPAFADAAELVYTLPSNPSNIILRNVITKVACAQANALYTEDIGARFREVAGSVPQLGSELAKELANLHKSCHQPRVSNLEDLFLDDE